MRAPRDSRAAWPSRAPLWAAGVAAAAALVCAPLVVAATSRTAKISDEKGDVSGPLDLQRASLALAKDGRLRAVVTLVGKVQPSAMLGKTGPPGSVCLKFWTAEDADPSAGRADRLVCVTARTKDELRASVLSQTKLGPPTLVGPADVRVNKSRRSLLLRFSQSSLGRPAIIRFAVESTRPGCERLSCIDQAPDKGAVRRFRFR